MFVFRLSFISYNNYSWLEPLLNLGSWKPQFLLIKMMWNESLFIDVYIYISYLCIYIKKPFWKLYLNVLALYIKYVFYWHQNASHWSKVMHTRQQRIEEVCSRHRKILRRFLNHNRLLFDTRHHLAYCRNAKVLQQLFFCIFEEETTCR